MSKMVNFVYGTEPEKYVFRLVKCVERRRNSKFPLQESTGKNFTVAITDGRKRGSVKPMKLRFCK